MTTVAKIIVSTLLGILMTSCHFDMHLGPGVSGNGNVITESRNVSENFTAIEASAGLDVYLIQGNQISVEVEADENLHDMIKTYVENETLYLTVDGNIKSSKSKRVDVSFKNVSAITSTSGSDVYAEDVIVAKELKLSSTSGSDMTLKVDVDNLSLESSSGADLNVSGQTIDLFAEASSGSDISAKNLVSQSCEASASSGADISVNTKKKLIAKSSSGGDIHYTGHPERVEKIDN